MLNTIKKFLSIIRGQIYFEYNPNIHDTVLLSGSGRSGTTWLSDIINQSNSFRYMFEPFHPELVSVVKHFNSRQYLRTSDISKEYFDPASKILSGNVRNLWIDRYNRKTFPQKRLIKDIRINLLLKWIKANFPEIPIVFMMRHPFSVACSRIRLGWNDHLHDLFKQTHLMAGFQNIFSKVNYENLDEFEKQVLLWCVENYVPIKSLRPDEMYIMFYENLFTNPVNEIRRLFEYLNLPLHDNVFEKINNPSSMTKKNSPLITGEDPLNYWKKQLNQNQCNNALKIMEIFGLINIYGKEALPNIAGINKCREIDLFKS